MNASLLTVVLASNTCDSLELALEESKRALADAIQSAIAAGVTIEEIEDAAGIEIATDQPPAA